MNNNHVQKYKISHISTVHSTRDPRIVYKEVLSLAKAGYSVYLILQKDKIYVKHDNIKYVFIDKIPGLLGRIKKNLQTFRKAVQIDAALYHFHDPELIFLGLFLKIVMRKIVIYDIHELHGDEILHKHYLNKVSAFILSKMYTLVETISIKFFDHLILAEAGYQDYYKNRKYLVLQNFIPRSFVRETLINEHTNADVINLVYLGTITRARGIKEILQLAFLLKDRIKFFIHLIGPFESPEVHAETKDFITNNLLSSQFQIYGELPLPHALGIVEKCQVGIVFLHPILNNRVILSTKFFDYMSQGLILLMTNFDLWERFNEKYQCGLTVDIFAISREIDRICEFFKNKHSMRQTQRRNLENVKKKFIWEVEELKLLKLYSELVPLSS